MEKYEVGFVFVLAEVEEEAELKAGSWREWGFGLDWILRIFLFFLQRQSKPPSTFCCLVVFPFLFVDFAFSKLYFVLYCSTIFIGRFSFSFFLSRIFIGYLLISVINVFFFSLFVYWYLKSLISVFLILPTKSFCPKLIITIQINGKKNITFLFLSFEECIYLLFKF